MKRILAAMRISFRYRFALAGIALLSSVLGTSLAQDAKNADQALEGAVVTKLSPLIYPPLARQTRITGDVQLKLEVRPNGSVASAAVVSGHPLLSQFALENAQQSQFACENCGEDVHSFRLVYTFELSPPGSESELGQANTINPEHPGLRITRSEGHVIVADQPVCLCDPAPDHRKVRSLKCLYLWKCGTSL
jgi:TonB family protein